MTYFLSVFSSIRRMGASFSVPAIECPSKFDLGFLGMLPLQCETIVSQYAYLTLLTLDTSRSAVSRIAFTLAPHNGAHNLGNPSGLIGQHRQPELPLRYRSTIPRSNRGSLRSHRTAPRPLHWLGAMAHVLASAERPSRELFA